MDSYPRTSRPPQFPMVRVLTSRVPRSMGHICTCFANHLKIFAVSNLGTVAQCWIIPALVTWVLGLALITRALPDKAIANDIPLRRKTVKQEL